MVICLCDWGCPFTFRSRRAGDPARREGAGGGALGHNEGCERERGCGDPSRVGAETSSSRTRGEKKAKVERFGRKMWASWSASNFKEPDDHLKRRSHPFWLLHRGLVLSRLASLRQTSRRRVWIWSGGLRTLLPGLRSSSSFRSLEKKRARRAHLVSLP